MTACLVFGVTEGGEEIQYEKFLLSPLMGTWKIILEPFAFKL
jgi:hypothetical protein